MCASQHVMCTSHDLGQMHLCQEGQPLCPFQLCTCSTVGAHFLVQMGHYHVTSVLLLDNA